MSRRSHESPPESGCMAARPPGSGSPGTRGSARPGHGVTSHGAARTRRSAAALRQVPSRPASLTAISQFISFTNPRSRQPVIPLARLQGLQGRPGRTVAAKLESNFRALPVTQIRRWRQTRTLQCRSHDSESDLPDRPGPGSPPHCTVNETQCHGVSVTSRFLSCGRASHGVFQILAVL